MDFDALLKWLDANKDWLFSGAGVAVLTAIAGFVWRRHSTVQAGRDVHYQVGPQVDVNDLVKTLLEAQPRQQDVARERIEELIRGQEETQQQVRELTDAVRTLAERQNEPDAPPGIEAALRELARGETSAAEAIFEQVLERKKAVGEAASKEAAAAARHIGALAYLHDTQKALSAYAQAVELDPENPDGWNMFGVIQKRLGNLDSAIKAFERVLALGNKVDDKAVVAAAYGNLGIVYKTRGELAKAEEHFLKSLAIEEELGRKEGMANAYGNLGLIYQTRGDLDEAEDQYQKVLQIENILGRKESMANAYCGPRPSTSSGCGPYAEPVEC